jgi:glycosyltransferase involved in cell wall biosynthesis
VGWGAELKALAASLGVADRIAWPGMLTGDLKWGAIRCAEAFVLPSHQENFGIAVVEAMACGVPVLISNQVNIWREIEEDRAGLVEADTEAGTTSLLSRWLSLEPEEVEILRRNTIPAFKRRFEIQAAARSLIEAINGAPAQTP